MKGINIDEELEQLERKQAEQMNKFAKELQHWLDERGIALSPTTIIKDGRVLTAIDVVPKRKSNGQ